MHTSGIIPSPTSHSARSSHSTICSHRLRRSKSSPGGVHSRWHKKTSYDSSHIARRSQNATQSASAGSTSAPIHSATVAQPAPVRRAFRTHCKRSKSPAAYCSAQVASQGACSSRSRQRCCSAQLARREVLGQPALGRLKHQRNHHRPPVLQDNHKTPRMKSRRHLANPCHIGRGNPACLPGHSHSQVHVDTS